MTRFLILTVSALALAQGLASARAGEPLPPEDRFSTEVLLGPRLSVNAPTSPAYALGVEGITDSVTLIDPVVTGQIPNRDAEKAAEGVKPGDASQPAPESAGELGPGEPPAVDASPDAAHGGGAAAGEAQPVAEEKGEAAGHWSTERAPMPFDIIRTIQFLQDQVARGNGRAIQVQAMLLRRFGPVFVEADPEVWKDARNMRAAVLFVLSGGPPEVIKRLMANGSVDAANKPLFEGALAYIDNDMKKAETLLSGLDFTDMEPGLEAHVNLVLGQLKQKDDPKGSIPHLDRARLLAPGGLIEEAALRMEMLIVDGLGEHDSADRLARQYFDRYADSAYSANFEARFAAVYASRGKSDAAAAMATMLDVTERLADANKRSIFLAVGRRALVEGNLAFAALAADAAMKTDGISDADRQRAKLYVVAATLGTPSAPDPTTELGAIDRATLHPEDTKLLDAAYSVLDGIDRTPAMAKADAPSDQVADSSPVFDRAQQLLNEVAGDLGKAQP